MGTGKDATEYLERSLIGHGFRRHVSGILTRPATEEASLWIGLSGHASPGVIILGPNVGVRHHDIEKWRGRLLDAKAPPYRVTVLTPLRSLVKDPEVWVYTDGDHALLDDILQRIIDVGVPAVEPWVDLAATLQRLTVDSKHPGNDIRIPIALALLGDDIAARAIVEEHLADIADQSSLVADQYRQFAPRFLEALPLGRLGRR